MKTENQNPQVQEILEAHANEEVRLNVNGKVQFNYSGTLHFTSNGWLISRPGGIELYFQTDAVRCVYVNPAKTLAISIVY